MPFYLGIDTSNYTTSCAVYSPESGEAVSERMLLPVREGELGLRQNDAVFAHVKALGGLIHKCLSNLDEPVAAVAASVRPRGIEGSYMPCFLVGDMVAVSISAALDVPKFDASHQQGHIAAALLGSNRMELMSEPFIAFHISGGTTQCVHVRTDGKGAFIIDNIAESMDLHAGQAVDRVGAMLGLSFPAGPELEKLASLSEKSFTAHTSFKGMNPCLSGLENQCERLLRDGAEKADVAAYCLDYLSDVVISMTESARGLYPGLPAVYAGGVMSNGRIREKLEARFDGLSFAPPKYSADNAAGVAVLCAEMMKNRQLFGKQEA